MPFKFSRNQATAGETCSVEDALPLLEFLQSHPRARIDLGGCVHLHTAVLQVLLAARPQMTARPRDALMADVLARALGPPTGKAAK